MPHARNLSEIKVSGGLGTICRKCGNYISMEHGGKQCYLCDGIFCCNDECFNEGCEFSGETLTLKLSDLMEIKSKLLSLWNKDIHGDYKYFYEPIDLFQKEILSLVKDQNITR